MPVDSTIVNSIDGGIRTGIALDQNRRRAEQQRLENSMLGFVQNSNGEYVPNELGTARLDNSLSKNRLSNTINTEKLNAIDALNPVKDMLNGNVSEGWNLIKSNPNLLKSFNGLGITDIQPVDLHNDKQLLSSEGINTDNIDKTDNVTLNAINSGLIKVRDTEGNWKVRPTAQIYEATGLNKVLDSNTRNQVVNRINTVNDIFYGRRLLTPTQQNTKDLLDKANLTKANLANTLSTYTIDRVKKAIDRGASDTEISNIINHKSTSTPTAKQQLDNMVSTYTMDRLKKAIDRGASDTEISNIINHKSYTPKQQLDDTISTFTNDEVKKVIDNNGTPTDVNAVLHPLTPAQIYQQNKDKAKQPSSTEKLAQDKLDSREHTKALEKTVREVYGTTVDFYKSLDTIPTKVSDTGKTVFDADTWNMKYDYAKILQGKSNSELSSKQTTKILDIKHKYSLVKTTNDIANLVKKYDYGTLSKAKLLVKSYNPFVPLNEKEKGQLEAQGAMGKFVVEYIKLISGTAASNTERKDLTDIVTGGAWTNTSTLYNSLLNFGKRSKASADSALLNIRDILPATYMEINKERFDSHIHDNRHEEADKVLGTKDKNGQLPVSMIDVSKYNLPTNDTATKSTEDLSLDSKYYKGN